MVNYTIYTFFFFETKPLGHQKQNKTEKKANRKKAAASGIFFTENV